MPSKRKYNARFPAGRIKKIMQTDEEVGKVAQAVPIIISRTLELFVESLLTKAKQVTMSRNAKTLSPSHVKQCILAESRFDFLRDLVKNIPDVSAAEEKEMISAESSPNSSRFSDTSVPPRRIVREDSNSSSSSDVRIQQISQPRDTRGLSAETELPNRTVRPDVTSTIVSTDTAIDLSKKTTEEKPLRTANFYQETLIVDNIQQRSVIKLNPTYASPQPSTSYTTTIIQPQIDIKNEPVFYEEAQNNAPTPSLTPMTPVPPVTPILNIDFSKNVDNPEIKVLDTAVVNIVGVPKETQRNSLKHLPRQNSKQHIKSEIKKIEIKPLSQTHPLNIDHLNSGNLQIDEDYDT